MRRYVAWSYWFAVVMVGIFGTMAADVLHVGFGVPYIASSILYAILLAAVYFVWYRTERTLSIHSIDTARREAFYWAAVVATFAMGTALGDMTAITVNMGYTGSIILFAVIILIPAAGFRFLHWNSIFCFWFAYVITRPLGASVADWLGKPTSAGGLGLGGGPVSAVFALVIIALVWYLAVRRTDVQRAPAAAPRPRRTRTRTSRPRRSSGRRSSGSSPTRCPTRRSSISRARTSRTSRGWTATGSASAGSAGSGTAGIPAAGLGIRRLDYCWAGETTDRFRGRGPRRRGTRGAHGLLR